MRNRRLVVAALCVALVLPFAAQTHAIEVQPISEAERAAVQIAADYLSRGPVAVAEQLATTSPLRKLSSADQLADLEVRLGPPERAQWDLQTATADVKDRMAIFSVTYPAGFEDHVAFDLVREGNAFKVQDVRFLALSTAAKVVAAPAAAAAPMAKKLPVAAGAGALAALLALVIAIASKRKPLRVVSAITAIIAIAASLFFFRDFHQSALNASAIAPKTPDGPVTLAPL
ncbi:MAG: hypothetical protein ACJ74H_16730, partial [Thermoanaerobaculia bacterium]